MSSLWDTFGQQIYNNKLNIEDIEKLLLFLKQFDVVNKNVVTHYLSKNDLDGYKFEGYDKLLEVLQNKTITKNQFTYFISELHSFDHENNEILMYSFSKDENYWSKHVCYRSCKGTFREGKWKIKMVWDTHSKPISDKRENIICNPIRHIDPD